jgi:hypothetical protein
MRALRVRNYTMNPFFSRIPVFHTRFERFEPGYDVYYSPPASRYNTAIRTATPFST